MEKKDKIVRIQFNRGPPLPWNLTVYGEPPKGWVMLPDKDEIKKENSKT